ncbi:hypothetical protein MKK75_01995 [Methylobacterium sp. J-030]|nr:hypothetical protein [Methylobacterium sp. J-030]
MRNATVREEVAFAAGIKPVRQTALTAAVTLETHEGSTCVRDCTAIQALQDFAEDLDVLVLGQGRPDAARPPGDQRRGRRQTCARSRTQAVRIARPPSTE